MKHLTLITAIFITCQQMAQAEHNYAEGEGRSRAIAKPPLYCVGSNGYELMSNLERKTASLKKNHEAVAYGDLKCVTLYPKCEENAVDCGPTLICKSKVQLEDAGYTVTVVMPPDAKKFKGTVEKLSDTGSKKVSRLSCVRSIE